MTTQQCTAPVQEWRALSSLPRYELSLLPRDVITSCSSSQSLLDRADPEACRILTLLSRKGQWASLVAQWLRVCLLMQGTRVRALVWEDPTRRGATGPVSHDYWACASGACAPQRGRPQQWEARAPRWRVAPACRNWGKPSHRNEDPTQPKINK